MCTYIYLTLMIHPFDYNMKGSHFIDDTLM